MLIQLMKVVSMFQLRPRNLLNLALVLSILSCSACASTLVRANAFSQTGWVDCCWELFSGVRAESFTDDNPLIVFGSVIDLPFSLVADLLFSPYDLYLMNRSKIGSCNTEKNAELKRCFKALERRRNNNLSYCGKTCSSSNRCDIEHRGKALHVCVGRGEPTQVTFPEEIEYAGRTRRGPCNQTALEKTENYLVVFLSEGFRRHM